MFYIDGLAFADFQFARSEALIVQKKKDNTGGTENYYEKSAEIL